MRLSVRTLYAFVLASILVFSSIMYGDYHHIAYAAYTKATVAHGGPTLDDPNLKVDLVVKGLDVPTSMAFLGPNNILVLEKNTGAVVRIVDGQVAKTPLLRVDVPQG